MIYQLAERTPQLGEEVYVAPDATIIGAVSLGARSSVWFNSVLRGDTAPITIGTETNIQDLSMCHADPGKPLSIGDRVTIGHRCIVHGCQIEEDCLIGMGAIIMNGAVIGKGSIVAAGAVVLEGASFPSFSLIAGAPAKLKKTYDENILETIRRTAATYVERAVWYRKGLRPQAL